MEIGFGLMIFDGGSIVPSGNIGWRWQLPGPSFILRMGVGVPELAYLGIGFSFG